MNSQPLDFEKPIVELEQKLGELRGHSRENNVNLDPEVRRMESKIEEMKKNVYSNLTAWQRVQIARQVIKPPGDARQDWWIIQEIGKRMGLPWNYDGPADVFTEMTQLMPSLQNITWERLVREGITSREELLRVTRD